MIYFLSVLVLIAGVFGYRYWSRKQTRAELLSTPLNDHQRAVIGAQVPLTNRLPRELRDKLEGKISLFLHQIEFIGCDGLEVTEEMRLSIATQACLLVANTDTWYKNLYTILIYPGAFKSRRQVHDGYVVTEEETVRLGESWARGPVVLSWAHSQQGAINDRDGHNVVFHEFAHQIDDLSGHTDGVPVLGPDQSFAEWAQVFVEGYEAHLTNLRNGRDTVIDPYGAEGHEEFFAVAVEVFFERPQALYQQEPAVYDELSKLFRLDPKSWV
ncbi:zinc-dependent peptidase [Aliiroseovarius sp. 2305UL8-7]|uniref:M90 family metallopeptidase n=1 Tax=Aliiroseovarius conchicola TaxID=3121637 RepID=UPI0035279981